VVDLLFYRDRGWQVVLCQRSSVHRMQTSCIYQHALSRLMLPDLGCVRPLGCEIFMQNALLKHRRVQRCVYQLAF
jgi:hypothetical protein